MEVENYNIDQFSEKARADYKLVVAAQNGDQKAFAKLLSRYRESVFFMIIKMVKNHDDAEDLTMDSFGRAFRNIKFYKPTSAFSTWLFRIASNNAIDFIRSNKQRLISIDKAQDDDSDSPSFDPQPILVEASNNPEQNLIYTQKERLMRQIVDELPEDYGLITSMRYFEEKSYTEIAEELNLPIGTVKARLFRSRELLLTIIKAKKIEKDKI